MRKASGWLCSRRASRPCHPAIAVATAASTPNCSAARASARRGAARRAATAATTTTTSPITSTKPAREALAIAELNRTTAAQPKSGRRRRPVAARYSATGSSSSTQAANWPRFTNGPSTSSWYWLGNSQKIRPPDEYFASVATKRQRHSEQRHGAQEPPPEGRVGKHLRGQSENQDEGAPVQGFTECCGARNAGAQGKLDPRPNSGGRQRSQRQCAR